MREDPRFNGRANPPRLLRAKSTDHIGDYDLDGRYVREEQYDMLRDGVVVQQCGGGRRILRKTTPE